jgi:ATP synthase protein I
MSDQPKNKPLKPKPPLSQEVGAKAARKLRAQRHVTRTVWFGLGMMGLIGWSVVIPTLLGAALGIWLDKRYPGSHSWTLMLLVIGLIIGCVNAWLWVAKEDTEMREEQEDNDE